MPFPAGGRPKILMDSKNNGILIYDGPERNSGNLYIAASTSASGWSDWRVVHCEEGPFVNEMLFDPTHWKQDAVLSVMVQEAPARPHQPTPLRILDFTLDIK
jgi:hypothetical protein